VRAGHWRAVAYFRSRLFCEQELHLFLCKAALYRIDITVTVHNESALRRVEKRGRRLAFPFGFRSSELNLPLAEDLARASETKGERQPGSLIQPLRTLLSSSRNPAKPNPAQCHRTRAPTCVFCALSSESRMPCTAHRSADAYLHSGCRDGRLSSRLGGGGLDKRLARRQNSHAAAERARSHASRQSARETLLRRLT